MNLVSKKTTVDAHSPDVFMDVEPLVNIQKAIEHGP